ncbi:ArsR family transcriptional regulator [Clostridium tetanomorphum]|uniref:Winged helix-turn-helix transcriptional regulator n=1 Tax=Clostridium tetanomorphum TaxID=1553 RepID=A0A923E8I2_CLOTT|nr:metalloregulator ArsR/SmtB family transcription factor [Clostridium tetanomorphum]KAJ48934.1 Transcriptional regulator HTH-type, ArsR family protein [Clostridium tetanomorphum DSM 665]KAJ52991.1 Transcriptional regulator HTH-type, ArsR family protein [Clostridium tetanomorphum DSM 665]MBC2398522.1 winged helix-turn-helix transcriptional regulator [Clostridium tetanomorphum]MBP1864932.1 ArsR family transcriptional regulator [Clostridium tetanomorphum]NRS83138.1 ArsR family transcriptional re
MDVITILKALSDENRIRILNILNYGELCVCEIEYILQISQSNVSRHLNRLNNAKIIENYKKAQFVYYKINEDTVNKHNFIKDILNNEMSKIEQCKIDMDNFKKFKESKIECNTIKFR